MILLFLYWEAERTEFDLHEGNSHLCLLYIQANSSQVSACSRLSQCLMTSLNTECTNTFVSYKLRSWSIRGPATKHLAVSVWLLDLITSALFEAIVCSFLYHIATCFKSYFSLKSFFFLYKLIGTFAFLSLPTPSPLHSSQWVVSSGSVERAL